MVAWSDQIACKGAFALAALSLFEHHHPIQGTPRLSHTSDHANHEPSAERSVEVGALGTEMVNKEPIDPVLSVGREPILLAICKVFKDGISGVLGSKERDCFKHEFR
jgi:hypothetical protein